MLEDNEYLEKYTEETKGYLKEQLVNPKDYLFGVSTPVEFDPINPLNNWTSYLPEYEPQRKNGLETMACVTFSTLNCLEMLTKFHTNKEPNYSDRYTAEMSGTGPRGNYMSHVAESVRLHGVVPETYHPFDVYTWDEYYQEIPQSLQDAGKRWLKDNKFNWYWVTQSDYATIKEALKVSPLTVTVYSNEPKNSLGYYINSGKTANHCISLYNITPHGYECYDHYDLKYKKYDINYRFSSVMGFKLTQKYMENNPLELKNNTLISAKLSNRLQLGLYLDGKIIVDDEFQVYKTWTGRNIDVGLRWFGGGHALPISEEDYNKYDKVDLKGRAI